VECRSGETFTGFLVDRNEKELVLKLATGQEKTIPADRVASTTPLERSLMPEGLLDLLTEQEVADLLAYLQSLR